MSLPYFVRQETRVTSSCQDFFPLLLSKNTTEEDKRMSETLSLFLSPVHGSLFLWLAACNWVEPALSLANFLHVSFFFVIECSVFWSFSAYITFLLVLLSLLTLFDCFLKWSCSLLYFFYLIACHFWLSKERSCSQGKVTIVHSMLVFLHPEWMSTFFDFRLRSSLHWQLWSGWEDEEIMTREYLYWVIESLERLDGEASCKIRLAISYINFGNTLRETWRHAMPWERQRGLPCNSCLKSRKKDISLDASMLFMLNIFTAICLSCKKLMLLQDSRKTCSSVSNINLIIRTFQDIMHLHAWHTRYQH